MLLCSTIILVCTTYNITCLRTLYTGAVLARCNVVSYWRLPRRYTLYILPIIYIFYSLSTCCRSPTEDYGLEVLFTDCWSKCSGMEFLKVHIHQQCLRIVLLIGACGSLVGLQFWERSVPDWVFDVIFPQLPDKDGESAWFVVCSLI